MKVGIITFHRAHNLGAILQAYALTTYINSNICEAELIDFYPNNAIPRNTTLIYKCLRMGKHLVAGKKYEHRILKEKRMLAFMDHYAVSNEVFYGDKDIINNPPEYDVLISGGDQILNQTLSGNSESYYLTFDRKTRKISYSSSFGRTQISLAEQRLVREELTNFDCLACREISGAKIIESLTGKKAQVVVDPIFLLDANKWNQVSSDTPYHKPYIFVYAMECTDQLINTVNTVKDLYNLPIVVVQGKKMDCVFGEYVDETCGPAELIRYICDATVVVTNSFHGAAFSILFKKNFYAVAHSERNARLEDLLRTVHAEQKLIGWENNADEISAIDGRSAYSYIEPIIKLSKEYLYQSITGEKWVNQPIQIKQIDNIETVVKTQKCSYCRACVQICPQNAVSIIKDKTGNKYPKVILDSCISCGICTKVCPNINPCLTSKPDKGYAMRIHDEKALSQSTSGGVFTALSDYFLDNDGVIVGAAFDKEWKCRHILASSAEDRDRMRGAKYLQSDVGDIFIQVSEMLKSGRKVLFTGTPCQVAGIKNYLNAKRINPDNLLLVDIVCHGVASQTFFDKHIEYLKKKYGNIIDYRFRSKEIGWHGYNVRVELENGRILLNNIDANGYADLYFRSLMMRESCLHCQYSSISRVGDITIGDFWGIDKITDAYNDDKGVSSVFANTDKGKEYINKIRDKAQVSEYPIELCMQPNLKHAAAASPEAQLFIHDMERRGLEYCVKHYTDCHPVGYLGRKYRRLKRKIERIVNG